MSALALEAVGVRGKESMTRTYRGSMKWAMRERRNSISSAGSNLAPC